MDLFDFSHLKMRYDQFLLLDLGVGSPNPVERKPMEFKSRQKFAFLSSRERFWAQS